MVARLFIDLARLVESWWKIDRIRASPREGRILRLQPPCVVVVENRPAEVLARTLGQGASPTATATAMELMHVVYDCRSARGACRLTVTVTASGAIAGVDWMEDGVERRIMEEDVEVYSS
jgi:hypothetical protein